MKVNDTISCSAVLEKCDQIHRAGCYLVFVEEKTNTFGFTELYGWCWGA